MNWIKQLGFDLNIPRINYGVYEQDIKYFGGSVVYQDRIIAGTRRSEVEEAIITLGDFSSHAFMERFRDGSAALLFFIKEGAVSEEEIKPITEQFLNKMYKLAMEDESYLLHARKRKQKQGAILLTQIMCVVMALVTFIRTCNAGFTYQNVILVVIALWAVLVWGRFYSYIRTCEIKPIKKEET